MRSTEKAEWSVSNKFFYCFVFVVVNQLLQQSLISNRLSLDQTEKFSVTVPPEGPKAS